MPRSLSLYFFAKASRFLGIIALASLLAMAFLGSRPLWDHDEGRYVNVALNMLESGDWLTPRRHHETGHWTKPPATYWAIAASLNLFGQNEWAARLPGALAYLICLLCVFWIARRLTPATAHRAALVYASMALPVFALNWISADFLLSAAEIAAVACYVESRFGRPNRGGIWLLAMWGAFALAFLLKGPPAVLPLLAIFGAEVLTRPAARPLRGFWLAGFLVFLLLAGSWFIAVGIEHPGLLSHLLGKEVAARFVTTSHNRNGEWYGWLLVYAPVLLLGSLPWTRGLLRAASALPGQLRRWRDPQTRRDERGEVLLALWFLLPLLVFCLARSRMPLYLLPLWAPLAMLIAGQVRVRGSLLVAWLFAVLAVKASIAYWPTSKNAEAFALAIAERVPSPPREVVFVEDMARYGVHFYLGAQVGKISLRPVRESTFDPEYDSDLESELVEGESDVVYIAKAGYIDAVAARAAELGYRLQQFGDPFFERVLFTLIPAQSSPVAKNSH